MSERLNVARLASALLLAVAVEGAQPAFAQGAAKVIVHPDVETGALSASELTRIYLGKKTFWDSGDRITPALLDEGSPITESFLEGNVKKTVRQYRAYWKKRLFSGQGTAPKAFGSSRLVADFVASNPGAIGVVDSEYQDDRVKVVELEP